MDSNTSSFVSTFLSHASVDKPLVEAVAQHLGRMGVLTWFDKNELLEMGPLDTTLKKAVQQQATLTIFLSEASAKSSWCRDELKWAIEAQAGCDHLLPVYLGDRLKLVKAHDVLCPLFLNADGDQVTQLGSDCQQNPTASEVEAIAEMIAVTAYRRSIPGNWSEAVIYLDQRGSGQRRGFPSVPNNVARLESPTLTFRPSSGLRQLREILAGSDWEETVKSMDKAFSIAFGTVRGETRKVRVLGHAQTSLMWAVGTRFDRTTSADLYGYDRDGQVITNKDQMRHTSLSYGDPNAAEQINGQPMDENATYQQIALGVGPKAKYALVVQQAVPDLPFFWMETGLVSESEQAMKIVSDIVAVIEKFRQKYRLNELTLFWMSSGHLALLTAANLSHVVPKIKFMEWNHDTSEYVHLAMPGDN